MIELFCEYLSVRFIWLYVLNMSRTHFKWIHTLELPERQGTPGPKLLRNLKLSDCNWNRTHNHLHTYFPVCKCLFKWLWIPLAYFGTSNLRITSPVTKLRFCACLEQVVVLECGFTLKRVRDMIKTYNLQYVFQKVSKTINVLYKLQKKLSGAPLVRFHIMLQLCLFEGF